LIHVPESHRHLLEAPGVATLVTNSANGYPQATAVAYFLDEDGDLKISLNTTRQKTKNLERNPQCTIFFVDPANPYSTLEIRADAELTPDEDKAFAVRAGAKYGMDFREHDRPGESRVVVTLRPAKVNTYGS
jgi:PPOX class probable F420-dependent enzyme